MRRSFNSILMRFKPELVLFLGDLFDGGREIDNDEDYKREKARMTSIFSLGRGLYQEFFMAGNHDIGLDMRDHVVDRFRRFFGALDYKFEWGQHELIVLDTISLSFGDDDSRRYAEELLGSLSKSSTELPRILFSHIPLYRPEGSGCGNSMRTSLSPIKQAYGYQYQNLISEDISVRVMR
eukprot:Partr_v1_DN25775_c2_g1_i2_m74516 putative Metallophosphoesterase 1